MDTAVREKEKRKGALSKQNHTRHIQSYGLAERERQGYACAGDKKNLHPHITLNKHTAK
ncbi:MAG: hypothetical protein ACK40G_17145 [Cytophagaceae bacterium]